MTHEREGLEPGPRHTLLVVDDDEAGRRATCLSLAASGHRVIDARSGAECIDKIRTENPALVLLDVVMPDMDGTEVCRRIKNDPDLANVFVVFLSGKRTSSDEQAEGLDLGADGYIARPVGSRELIARIELLLRLREMKMILGYERRKLDEAQRLFGMGSWEHDYSTGEVAWSGNMYALLGVEKSIAPMCGHGMRRFFHPDDADEAMAAFERLHRKGMDFDLDLRVVAADGELRHVNVVGIAVKGPSGEVALGRGTFLDITERKALDEELRRSEERVRATLYSIGDGVIATDSEAMITHLNRVAERLTGWTEAEALGRRADEVFRIVNEDTRAPVDDPVLRVLKTGKTIGLANHTLLISRDGTERPIADSGAPIIAGDGKAVGVVLVFRDQSAERAAQAEQKRLMDLSEKSRRSLLSVLEDQTRAEQALRESAALMRIAGKAARIGGWSVDLPGNRVDWSEEVARIHEVEPGTRRTIEECIGFYEPQWRPVMAQLFSECAEEGTPYDEEMELVTARGNRIWVRTIGEAVRDMSGAVVRVQGALQDITETVREREEKARLLEQLAAVQKMEAIGRLAGGIAHDFNNLLTVVVGYSEMLGNELVDDKALHQKVVEIHKAGKRATNLTRQLLAYSRKQVLKPQVVDLAETVGDMRRMLERLIGENIEVSFESDADLGSVMADRGQIEQVIVNLSLNARDAMPDGGKLVLSLSNFEATEGGASDHDFLPPGSYVQLAISDDGSGMDASTRARLFEPFFTTKAPGKGTGLGLATVHGIVKQSGGYIWAESEPGRGSTFRVLFPRAATGKPGQVPGEAVKASRGTETILLAEDDDAVRRIVTDFLADTGYRIIEASSGEEAVAMARAHIGQIDLLLSDVVMPGMSGTKLAGMIAAVSPETKVLFMSGYTDDAIERHGVLSPGTAFIEKPFSQASLTAKIRELLGKPRR